MQPFGRVSAYAVAMNEAYDRRRQGSAKENAETALLFTAEKSAPMRENEWEALAEIAIGCTFADCWANTRKGSKGHWVKERTAARGRHPMGWVRLESIPYALDHSQKVLPWHLSVHRLMPQ